MIQKVYDKIKQLLMENYRFIFILLAFYFVLNIPLPYYIHSKGGLINISDKVKIENEHDKTGSMNLSYVTEMRGNVLTCALSYVIPGWDLVSQDDYVSSNETYEDADYRNHILLDEANGNATMVAYDAAKKEVNVKEKHFLVVYVDEVADTTLKVGDEILSVEGVKVNSLKDYINTVGFSKVGDKLNITVIDKDKKKTNRMAKVFEHDDRNVTGILVASNYVYETNPKITFHFAESESGPSGGLMMALAIYDKLTTENLTHGLTVVGTGTIDIDGNVGEISGIEYKLKGAVDAHADIFLAPLGDNYEDAMKIAKKNNYKIKIVGVSTFTDALNYLRSV